MIEDDDKRWREPERRREEERWKQSMAYLQKPPSILMSVYIDDGRIFEYTVENQSKAREHSYAICQTGYRHSPAGEPVFEHYPAHRIVKVKVHDDIETKYTDHTTGT